MLRVIKRFEGDKGTLEGLKKSLHFNKREEERLIKEETTIADMFIVEKDGKLQLHILLSNATILIVDKIKKKIVTIFNARVGQIKRYYTPLEEVPSEQLLTYAEHNIHYGLNS